LALTEVIVSILAHWHFLRIRGISSHYRSSGSK
jgi:hypothetical protein